MPQSRSTPATTRLCPNHCSDLIGAHAPLEQFPFQIRFRTSAVDGVDHDAADYDGRQHDDEYWHDDGFRVGHRLNPLPETEIGWSGLHNHRLL